MDSGSTSPSEGCSEAAEVHAAHGEVWDRGGGMHVHFACNVILAPVYPPAWHPTITRHTDHLTQPFGRMAPHHTLGTRPGHRMTQQRLKKGLAPPMSVACASASMLRDGSSLALDHPLSHSAPHPTVWKDDTPSHFGNPSRPPNDTAATQKGTCSPNERGMCLDK